jgi:RHS repeat-associated protein
VVGRVVDPETGLIYLTNRYYDPAAASFLNRDPLVGLTHAPYTYAGDDPINNKDPLGLFCYRMQSTSEYGPPDCPNNLPPDPNNPLEVWTPQQAWTPLEPCEPQETPQQQYATWLYTGGASSPQWQAQQALNEYVGNYPSVSSGPDTGTIVDILSAGASCIVGGIAGAEAGPAGVIIGCGVAAAYDYAGAPPGAENWFGAP